MNHDVLRIQGGTALTGQVSASGSKNAALPILAASILADQPVRIGRVPRLSDVVVMQRLLAELGVSNRWTADGWLELETVALNAVQARYQLVRQMRASFCVLGPLLARRQRAIVSLPGGCNIGPRPVDLHLAGLAQLGAEIRIHRGYVWAQADRLRGARIDLSGRHGSTVTGTANVLSAAVLAQGETWLTGAACEPEIVDLGRFLIALGAQIEGLGTSTLHIRGVEQLGGTSYQVIPDRIEAATLLVAGAITAGRVTVSHMAPKHVHQVLNALDEAGCQLQIDTDRVTLKGPTRPRPLQIVTGPYPAIPTDVQAQLMALCTLADGTSQVCETVFPQRFQHAAELARLGAVVEQQENLATVRGRPTLHGATVQATDLRASAALVLAGLAADGQTTVQKIAHLDRGYEAMDEKLSRLSGHVRRCLDNQPAVNRKLNRASTSDQ